MKTDLRYSASECFNTFPFPQPDPRTVLPDLEAIGETEDGYSALANYFGERDDELLAFAMSGQFLEDWHAEHGHESRSITWLNEKIEEIDEAMHEGDSITNSRPKVSRSEIADHDWMETAWVLRYELPDIFEQVIMTLRDRLQKRVDALTGLYNRRFLDERLHEELRRANRLRSGLAVLLIDSVGGLHASGGITAESGDEHALTHAAARCPGTARPLVRPS